MSTEDKGGVVAAQEIRHLDAHVPIVFQTGYGEQTQLDAAGSITHSAALQKPVLIPEMLRTIMAHIQGCH
jgi:CheY-like chemotaxis protein